ncbi:MAG: hypothetical protein F2817_16115 [Actinobacteria bacterium]|nr:hypothetical protein [Actinomycetota bacterium]
MSPRASSRTLAPIAIVLTALLGVLLLALTALLGWGYAAWFFSALLLAAAGLAGGLLVAVRSLAADASVVRATVRGSLPAVVGVLVCAAAIALPTVLREHENGELVAWSVPGERSVVLAEHGVALTVEEPPGEDDGRENLVVGRDLDDGRVRWRTRVPVPADAERGSYDGRWQRVGDVALVAGGPFRYAALDLRTGRLLWRDARKGLRISAVATTRAVASTRCRSTGDGDDEDAEPTPGASPSCVAEVRDLRTGRVRWRAPVARQGVYLGAPTTQRSAESGPLWPGRRVLVLAPDPRDGDRGPSWSADRSPAPDRPLAWAVRDLETGRTVRRGTTRGLSGLALAGGGLLTERVRERSGFGYRPRTTWSLLDLPGGRVRWSRTEDAGRADPGGPGLGIWLPSGRIPVARSPFAAFDVNVEDRYARGGGRELRLIDPRTGRVAAVPLGSADHLSFVAAPAPAVSTTSAARNPAPDATILLNVSRLSVRRTRMLLATPGRPGAPVEWARGAGRDYVATATLAARSRDRDLQDLTGEDQQDALEVRDVRTGEVVNRIRGWGTSTPTAVGERLTFDDGSEHEEDGGVTRVLRARP